MGAFAPYVSSYTLTTPYITADEFMASPTGVNVSQLVPRGTEEQNRHALNTVIQRASSYADMFCKQVLAATTDITSGRYRIQRTGVVRVATRFSPIVEVTSISLGFTPSSMTALTNFSNVWIDRKVVTFPIETMQLLPGYSTFYGDGRVYCSVGYVNGYANTLTTGAWSAGVTSATVASTLGMYPGVELTIYDTGAVETVFVQSVSGNTVTFTSPLLYAHDAGTNISALPAAVKQAVVLLTSALIKTRGSEAIVMQQLRQQPGTTTPIEGGGMQEIALAKEMLLPFVRTM